MTQDYQNDVKLLLKLLGGRNNISTASHCVSRLRLVIKDMNIIDDRQINQIKSIKGTIKLQNNQYHIIIGTDVENFFQAFSAISQIKQSTKEEVKKDAASQGNLLQKIIQHFSEIFIPLIPALVAGGIILGIRNIFEADFNGFQMVKESSFIKGVNDFL